MKDRLLAGTFRYDDYQTVIVKVSCDGETGWGEAMTRFSPRATALMVEWIGRQISGTEPESPLEAWTAVFGQLRVRGQTRGIAVEALSGVETAIWDAFGKLRRRPVGESLGRRRIVRVPAYAGSIFGSRGPIEEQVERVRSMGLRGFKIKVGFGVSQDVDLLRRARKLWEECLLVADANGSYDAAHARKLMTEVADCRPEWLEEPVPSDDFAGYRALAKNRKVPIGAGEAWYLGDFDLLPAGTIDVLEPSVSRCGGILTERSVAARAEKDGTAFSPMVGANSSISLAASLQVASRSRCIAVEYDAFDNPLVTQLTPGFPDIRNGELVVPEGDGLGIEVDEGFVSSHISQD